MSFNCESFPKRNRKEDGFAKKLGSFSIPILEQISGEKIMVFKPHI